MFIKATDRSRQLRPDPATETGKYLQVLLEGVLRNAQDRNKIWSLEKMNKYISKKSIS